MQFEAQKRILTSLSRYAIIYSYDPAFFIKKVKIFWLFIKIIKEITVVLIYNQVEICFLIYFFLEQEKLK